MQAASQKALFYFLDPAEAGGCSCAGQWCCAECSAWCPERGLQTQSLCRVAAESVGSSRAPFRAGGAAPVWHRSVWWPLCGADPQSTEFPCALNFPGVHGSVHGYSPQFGESCPQSRQPVPGESSVGYLGLCSARGSCVQVQRGHPVPGIKEVCGKLLR